MSKEQNYDMLEAMGLLVSDEEVKYIGILSDIAAEITTYRALNNLSQAQLAKKLNKKQAYVSKLESGENNLTIKKLSEISVLLEGNLQISLGIADYKAEIEKYENFFDIGEHDEFSEDDYSFYFCKNEEEISDIDDDEEVLAA
ncbi:MAG TPA: helix-turn-helix transcriptional regulator [Thermotogota bacterium]|nr:helix-turn-helix transcriptional regulator [Thermotogota bacterium]HPJ89286.1 helix-turn-helix transcriptional regulator [Thermotogota bacterium]HPR95157.1 helix-turn-helix transcriptional regulator [Thermotogota bacterium]